MSETLTEREARRLLGWGPKTVSVAGNVEQAQDIELQNGDLTVCGGIEALRQGLAAALVTSLGGDPLNLNFGFDGFTAIAEENDLFMLRERLRVAVVTMLQRDPRISKVDQVLIGDAEIEAAHAGQSTAPPPKEFGVMNIEISFRLRGRSEQLRMQIGSVIGSG